MKKITALFLIMVMLSSVFTACGNVSQTYASYVQAVMDCTYHGDTAQYIALTNATEQQAQMVYQTEIHSVVSLICQKFDVDMNYVSDALYEEYADFAKKLLSQIEYKAEPSIKANGVYQVTLTAKPPIFWETAFTYVENAYVSEYLPKFAKIPENDSTRYGAEMTNWSKKVVTVLNEHFSEITFQDTKYTIIQIQPDSLGRYNVSEQKWRAVDRFLLGLE